MSAEEAVQAALRAALAANAVISTNANGVHEERPARASLPWLELGAVEGSDWGAKDADGRELRTRMTVRAGGEPSAVVAALADAAGEAVLGLPRVIDGWSVGAIVPLRRKIARGKDGVWTAVVEHRLRVLRA